MSEPSELSDRDLLLSIHVKLASIETALSIGKWVFGSTVTGGVAWLAFLTVNTL